MGNDRPDDDDRGFKRGVAIAYGLLCICIGTVVLISTLSSPTWQFMPEGIGIVICAIMILSGVIVTIADPEFVWRYLTSGGWIDLSLLRRKRKTDDQMRQDMLEGVRKYKENQTRDGVGDID